MLFDLARWPAYGYTREHHLCKSGAAGYDRVHEFVRGIISEQLRQVPEHIHASQLAATAHSITEFCTTKLVQGSGRTYVDPAVAPQRRAAKQAFRNAVVALARNPRLAGLKKATVRNLAWVHDDKSAATVHRALMAVGIAPRRYKRIKALLPHQRKIVRILDSLVPRHGLKKVVLVDAIVSAAYPGKYTARSTKPMRQARTLDAMAVIATADIGLHIVVEGGRVGVARGVRIARSMSDIVTFIQTSKLWQVPKAGKEHTDPVDEALADILAMLSLACHGDPVDVFRLGNLCVTALDRRPLNLLCRELDIRDPLDIQWAVTDITYRSIDQGNPVRFEAYQDFIDAAFWLKEDNNRGKNLGEMIATFIKDSGYKLRLEKDCSRHARRRLNVLLGVAAALEESDCSIEQAWEMVQAWKKDKTSVPVRASKAKACSRIPEFSDSSEAIEILGVHGENEAAVSQSRYHIENPPQPGRPEGPPRRFRRAA